jgi:hypothetical protein
MALQPLRLEASVDFVKYNAGSLHFFSQASIPRSSLRPTFAEVLPSLDHDHQRNQQCCAARSMDLCALQALTKPADI